MKKLKVYLDTSILNFLFADDAPELKAATVDFFTNFVATGVYETFVSEYVLQEINKTTDAEKREKLLQVIEQYPMELLGFRLRDEIEFLANEYTRNGIIPENKKLDALHIAVATVHEMDFLASWNYKHLANISKEKKILAVNLQHNRFHLLRICTPLELLDYGS